MSKVIVTYGGGFQPFHQGHMSSYVQARQAFPGSDFFVVASNDTKTRPIPFDSKRFLALEAGVKDPFIQVKAPINPTEILKEYDPQQDIFIMVRSERDPVGYTKKDGSPGYFQPFVSLDKCESFDKHGYVFVTKKHTFSIGGVDIYSGSQVRSLYARTNDAGKKELIKGLYPNSRNQQRIKAVFDKYLSIIESIKYVQDKVLKEGTLEQKLRMQMIVHDLAEGWKSKVAGGVAAAGLLGMGAAAYQTNKATAGKYQEPTTSQRQTVKPLNFSNNPYSNDTVPDLNDPTNNRSKLKDIDEETTTTEPVKPFSQVKQYPLDALLTGQGNGAELKANATYRRDNRRNQQVADQRAKNTARVKAGYSGDTDEGDWAAVNERLKEAAKASGLRLGR